MSRTERNSTSRNSRRALGTRNSRSTGNRGRSTGNRGRSASARTSTSTRKRRRKPSFFKSLKNKIRSKIRNARQKLAKWFRAHKLRGIVLILAIVAILAVCVSHMFQQPGRLPEGNYEHSERFDGYTIVNGVDVSYAQGGNINWKKLKMAGVDFVFVRCGYRASETGELNPDEFYKQNLKKAHKAGLMVGAYFFSQATSVKEAKSEARYLVELVKDYDIDLPLVMDYETYGNGRLAKALNKGKLSTNKLGNIVLGFTKEIEAAGYDAALYANYSFLSHVLPGGDLSRYTNIWVAQYHTSCQFEGTYNFWQCTDSLEVDGIPAKVDRNFWYLKTGENIATGPMDNSRTAIGDCRIELKDHTVKFHGRAVEPGVIVSDGSRRMREGVDYLVSYVNNTAKGQGCAVVSGIGKYKDKCAIKFRIK